MDHLLTSNDRVTDTLMQTVRESRTIVLFMSRGYLRVTVVPGGNQQVSRRLAFPISEFGLCSCGFPVHPL